MCLLFCVQKSLTSLKVDKNLFCTCSGDFLNRLRSWGWWDAHYSFAGFYQLSKLYYSLAQNGRNEEHELTSETNMTTDVFYCKWLTGLMTFWSNGMNNMLMKDSGVVDVDVLGLISHRLQHSWHQGSAMCWPFLYFLSPLLLLRWSYHAKMLSWVCVCVCVLWNRLTAASNKPERRFRPRKIRIRSEHNSSTGFYHQPSITAAASSGSSGFSCLRCFLTSTCSGMKCDICCVLLLQENPSQCCHPDPAVRSPATVRNTQCVYMTLKKTNYCVSPTMIGFLRCMYTL